MIDFDLTEEHQLLEQTVREWARARSGAAHPRARSRAPLRSARILPQMAELGLLGCSVPPEYGGAGHGLHQPRPRSARSSSTSTPRCA